MSDLRFRMRSHCMIGDVQCVLCGEVFEQSLTALSLTRGADGEPPVDIGDVCLECLEAGPDGVAARALCYAKRLQLRALAKVALAKELQSRVLATGALAKELRAVEWPTVVAWGAFQDAHEAEIDKAMRENEAEIDKAMRENEGGL